MGIASTTPDTMPRPGPHVDANSAYDFSVDQDLNEIWPAVVTEFEKAAETKLDPTTTFESSQLAVNEKLRLAASKRNSNARRVVSNIG